MPDRSVRPIAVAAALTAATVCCALAARRHYTLRRVLLRERAAGRLTDARLHCDMAALRERLVVHVDRQRCTRELLEEADLVLDEALASHGVNDPYTEGGPG